MTRSQLAIDFVLRHEGGWSEDAADRGGPTRWGISQRAFPDVDLEALDRDGAVRIYREHYWERMRCDEMPPPLDIVLMDSAVNCGRRRTTRWLQEYCNHLVCEREPLKVDGVLGPVTARAVMFCPTHRLVALMIYRRQLHYLGLRRRYPQFFAGWIGRTTDLLCAVGGTE